jgi:hypothetical protein
MPKHSVIGASSCHRWWNCPGSVKLCEDVPKPPASLYAEEGTAAHELAEKALQAGIPPEQFLGQKSSNGFAFTMEMIEAVDVYYTTIMGDFREMFKNGFTIKNAEYLQIEHQFHLSWIDKDAFGTNDCNIAQPFGLLRVYDYKHGAGVPVDVVNNKQGLYYAVGAAAQGDFDEVEIVIVQPRAPHPDGPVRRWRFPINELFNFEQELHQKIRDTREKSDVFNAGDWCRFCPALAVCPTARKKAQAVAAMDFTKVNSGQSSSPPDPESLSNQQLSEILAATSLLDAWIKSVASHAQQRAERGEDIPGFKLVKKRANRRWINEEDVIDNLRVFCGNEIYNTKLKSPAQMEHVLMNEKGQSKKEAKKELEHFVETPDAGVVLVADSDSRKAVPPPAQTDFKPIT